MHLCNTQKYFALLCIVFILFPLFSYGDVIKLPKEGYSINKNYEIVPNNPKGNRKVILITIDDGPSKYSKDIVTTLIKHNAKAIFFINGIHHKKNPTAIAFEAQAGSVIGNHTWSHHNLKNEKSRTKAAKEINDTSILITKITGSPPKFFRPPYGMGTSYVRNLVKKDGMIYMNWSGATKDWEKSAQQEKIFISNVTEALHPGEILLIHEYEWTSRYLDNLLTTLEQKGYSFVDPNQITS